MVIRKITVGTDFSKSMNYVHGQSVINGDYKIHLILYNEETQSYLVWVEKDGAVMLWKSFNSNMPVTVEYNISL